MALEVINTGTAPNSADGDNLRAAMTKTKNNFAEIYADDFVTTARIADDVALGGNPTTTTQSAGDNSTKIATTAYADNAVANAIDAAPAALDTLNELAASLGDDANFAGTMTTSLSGKLSTAAGSVGTSNIADDAVTADKLANSINSEIAANTAKTGITSGQASAITANTAKVTNATHTGDVTGSTALTIANDVVDHDELAPRFTAKQDITTTSGTINLDSSSYGIFELTSALTGATTLNIQNIKKGQVIDILVTGSQTITMADDFTTSAINQAGSGTYDGAEDNHIQVICIDDNDSDAILIYSVATYTSDTDPS